MENPENPETIRFPRTVIVNGRRVCIRPITPDDRDRIVQGLRSMSIETSYRRFFTPTFYPSEKTLQYLTHIDGEQHVALGAVDCTREGNPGIGAVRYVRLPDRPSIAEAAVVVIDEYQQQGIGSMLIAALMQLQLVRFGNGLRTDPVRPYLTLENGATANCYPQKIV